MARNNPNLSLWQSLLSLRRMDEAWARVRANGGGAGGDNMTIAQFAPRAPRRLVEIAEALRQGSYRPGPCRSVEIPKRKGGTRRLLIPTIEDRIVHTALAQVLSPVLEPQFEDSSFAYRPGRSVQQAVAEISRWRDAGYRHVIEADIVDFFDNLRHDLLLAKLEAALAGQVDAEPVVDLVALILEHQSAQSGRMGRGVAQGSPLSPLLSNLYLDALDERLERRGLRLVRFADDFVILCKTRDTAERALAEASEALAAHGLELHDAGTRVVDFDRGFEFLGHKFVMSFVFQQVSDPAEDPVALLRQIAEDDAGREAERLAVEAAEARERRGGYDRGERVLYVTEPGRRLSLRNLSFVVEAEGGSEILAISHGRVDRIELGPGVVVDPAVHDHCLATQTDLVLVDGYGALRGALRAPVADNGGLHLLQAQAVLRPDTQTAIARALVDARIRNQRTQLFRLNRRPQDGEVTRALASMGRHLRKVNQAETVAALRGIEGVAAADYWPALGRLTRGAPQPFRRTRPGLDPLNAVINYLAALLARDMRAGVLAAGLHPGFGALHAARDREDACVYDMMEPFRAPLTEGLAAFLFNARRLRPEMFHALPDGGVRIGRPAVRAIIQGYEQAVAKRVNVTGRRGKLAWRPMMRRQAQDLAVALRAGEIARFAPYLMEA